jgi:hypothetical protein
VTGPYDVIVKAEAKDVDELGRMVVSRLQAIDGITRTLTCPVVNLRPVVGGPPRDGVGALQQLGFGADPRRVGVLSQGVGTHPMAPLSLGVVRFGLLGPARWRAERR